jgi:hypothetical protein
VSAKTILEMMTTTQPCHVNNIEDFVKGWKTIILDNQDNDHYFVNREHGELCKLLANMWIRDFATDTVLLTGTGMVFKSLDDATLFKMSCPSQTMAIIDDDDEDDLSWDEIAL